VNTFPGILRRPYGDAYHAIARITDSVGRMLAPGVHRAFCRQVGQIFCKPLHTDIQLVAELLLDRDRRHNKRPKPLEEYISMVIEHKTWDCAIRTEKRDASILEKELKELHKRFECEEGWLREDVASIKKAGTQKNFDMACLCARKGCYTDPKPVEEILLNPTESC
jgi:hypothetical protein